MRQLGLSIGVLLALTACHSGHNESITERAQSDHVTFVKAEDPAMLRAFSKARETLDGFLNLYASRNSDVLDASVKVKIEDAGEVEYFWIADFSVTPTGFSGRIDNDPELVRSVRSGELFTFTRSQIYDWTYRDKTTGRMIGNFTACALLTHESAEEAATFRKTYQLDCDT